MGNAKSKLLPKTKNKRHNSRKITSNLPESSSANKKVDPRLPFVNYRQLFNLKNSWKSISRCLEDTAKINLVLFFTKYPNHKALFAKLKDLETEEEMMEDINFEEQAVAIFTVFDEAMEFIETVDKALFGIQKAAHAHSSVVGFSANFFSDMESTFLEAVSHTLADRFTESTAENFRLLYQFVTGAMCEALGQSANVP